MKTRSTLLSFGVFHDTRPFACFRIGRRGKYHNAAHHRHSGTLFGQRRSGNGADYSANRSLSDGYEKPIPHR